jgi:cytochrome b561
MQSRQRADLAGEDAKTSKRTRMNERYTGPAIALHWLMALVLPVIFGVGLYMHDLPLSPSKLQIYSWHKWAGVTAFLLVVIRLAWRATHRPPALPAAMPAALRIAAHAGHGLLYLLMVAIPLTGWLMSSAKGFQTVYFGVLPIPDLLAKDKELGDLLSGVHTWLNYLLAAVVVGHVAAALKHHLVDRDDVLLRMLPRRRDRPATRS